MPPSGKVQRGQSPLWRGLGQRPSRAGASEASGAGLRRAGGPSAVRVIRFARPHITRAGRFRDAGLPYKSRSAMTLAARRPAPMAEITVAAPVTMSPPAKTLGIEVSPVSSLTAM